MFVKRALSLFILLAVLVSAFGFAPAASAAAPENEACGDSLNVQRGDTLRKIANRCETSVDALTRANPSIQNPNRIFPSQVLVLPGALLRGSGKYDTYVVDRGDNLRRLANRFDLTVNALLDLNPEIDDVDVIYEGQRLTVPAASIPDTGDGEWYTVQRGDTLRKIAAKFDTTVAALLKLNPQIKDANRIFTGQRILVSGQSAGGETYTVQRGDTLRKIANKFGTTVDALLKLNTQIKNPNRIFVGQVIRVK